MSKQMSRPSRGRAPRRANSAMRKFMFDVVPLIVVAALFVVFLNDIGGARTALTGWFTDSFMAAIVKPSAS